MKHLLERGADPTVRDAGGKLALDYARSGPPPGPGGANTSGPPAPRAATVALLESASKAGSKSGVSAEAITAR